MKFIIIALIGAFFSFATGGTTFLAIYGLALLGIYYYSLQRGLLFIQAYLFLKTFHQTADIKFSNHVACSLTTFESGKYIAEAMMHSERYCNGLQLPIIQMARDLGFRK